MAPAADLPFDAPEPPASSLLHDLDTQGYSVLRSHLPPELISTLLVSARKLTDAARSGHWPYLRTCPKQFPPWPSTPPKEGIWGVQHLLHPGLYKPNASNTKSESENNSPHDPPLTKAEATPFAALYFSNLILNPIKEILFPPHTSPNAPLIMELLNLLISPPAPFTLRWHRDSLPFTLSPTDEAAALGLIQTSESSSLHDNPSHAHNPFASTEHSYYTLHPAFRQHAHAQYNIPLVADSSLQIVPGSHLRPRTEREMEALGRDAWSGELEGVVEVRLEPGDVVFYNANLIHRGVYGGLEEGADERYTLHGSVSRADAGEERARTVLQHGVGEWVRDCEFAELLGGVEGDVGERLVGQAESMRRQLMELGGSGTQSAESVGFNHTD